jgi:hypothetical protein
MMLNQPLQDQTTYFNEKYERLTTDYEKLRQMAMEIRSHMGDPCVPLSWLHDPSDNQPLLLMRRHCFSFFFLRHHLCFIFIVFKSTNV